MGALSLTAAAVSGLELPALPDRPRQVFPPLAPVSSRTPALGTNGITRSLLPLGAVIGGRVRELVPVRVFAHEPHRRFELSEAAHTRTPACRAAALRLLSRVPASAADHVPFHGVLYSIPIVG